MQLSDIKIIRAESKDLEEILALQKLAYQSEAAITGDFRIQPLTQTIEEVREEFNRGLFLKAVDSGHCIVGSVRAYEADGTAHIGKLIVHPERQGQGIGTRLLAAVEAQYPGRRCELFTGARSTRNLALYQRNGYVAFARRRISEKVELVFLEKHNP